MRGQALIDRKQTWAAMGDRLGPRLQEAAFAADTCRRGIPLQTSLPFLKMLLRAIRLRLIHQRCLDLEYRVQMRAPAAPLSVPAARRKSGGLL